MFSLFKCFHGQHWPWATSWVGLCLLSLTGLTLWMLFNRYLLLRMLRLNDDLLIADRKFCIKLWKPAMETPNKAFSNKVTRRTLTFEGFSWFKYGESLVKDCECSGISSTDYTVQYVMKIHKIINESCNTLKGCWQVRPLIRYMPANCMEDLQHVADLHYVPPAAHCDQW